MAFISSLVPTGVSLNEPLQSVVLSTMFPIPYFSNAPTEPTEEFFKFQALLKSFTKEDTKSFVDEVMSHDCQLPWSNTQPNCYLQMSEELVKLILEEGLKVKTHGHVFGARFNDLIALVSLNDKLNWDHYNSHPGRSKGSERFVFQHTHTTTGGSANPVKMLQETLDALRTLYPTGKAPSP